MKLPINATLEERERLAYIEGRTSEAKLLADLGDAEEAAESCHPTGEYQPVR